MHSGYGGVSEIQQFMVDGCPSSLFSISTVPSNASPSAPPEIHASQKYNPLPHPHLQPPPPHFAHFGHPMSITQQLFQQTHHHQFQLFHPHQHQHLGLDQESGPETSNSPARMMGGGAAAAGGGPSFLSAMNFKLGVNERGGGGGGGGSRDGLNEDHGILQGDDGSESRLHHSWQREEESAGANIKERPFWRPLDRDYINPNNKRPADDKQPAEISSNVKHMKKNNEALNHNHATNNKNPNTITTDSNYKLFSELEAIYKPGSTPSCGGAGRKTNNHTGDDNPLMPVAPLGPSVEHQPDNISNTSNGSGGVEAAPPPPPGKFQKGCKSKRSKWRQQKQLASVAAFFESIVKQLMDHQEGLHRKFLEAMQSRDQERTNREEAWRKQEAAKANREAASRARERALAATREAAIISFVEKITGESLNLPTKAQFQAQFADQSDQKDHDDNLETQNVSGEILLNSSRWPKAEVQALIRVRSGFESRFQEPGLKGPLWEEVSMAMASMGYHRSAKRCKEKWENINKYFRKTKDSGKKRPHHSKSCPYFQQLDQLYSNSLNTNPPPSSSIAANVNEERNDNSELLDAILVSNETGKKNVEFNVVNIEDREEENSEEEGQGENQEQAQDRGNLN